MLEVALRYEYLNDESTRVSTREEIEEQDALMRLLEECPEDIMERVREFFAAVDALSGASLRVQAEREEAAYTRWEAAERALREAVGGE